MKTATSLFRRSRLATAVGLAVTSSIALAQQGNEQTIEEVQVLGSYIKGTDTAAANPVSAITADDMQYTGATDITDIMNTMAVNSGAENRPDTFTSFYNQGTSNVNLRGLGLSSTLVLINGKRQTLSGAKAQDGSVFVDTASIPAIAIERLEVLKEGAAAAYGSDAVAGVVNFITRDEFEGFKIEGSWQSIEGFDQEDKNLSLIGGFDISDSTHVVLAASALRRSNLQGWEKPELVKNAASGLGTAFKLLDDAVVTSGPWTGTYSSGDLVGNPNCDDVNGRPLDLDGDGDLELCGFKYGLHYNIVNEEEREQYYGSLTHDFDSGIELKVSGVYSDYRVIDNFSVPSLPNLNFPTIAADQLYNPFGVDVVIFGRHNPTLDYNQSRPAPRDNETFRLEGSLSGEFNNGWGWTTSLAYSGNEYRISQPEMSLSRLNAALDGNGGPNGDLTFNHFDPLGNSDELLEWLKTDFKSTTNTSLAVWDGVVNGELFEMPAGTVHAAFGAQIRRETYEVDPAENSTIQYDANGNPMANDFTFLGSVNEVDQSRQAAALFAEMEMPLTDKLTLNAALRYEELDSASSVDPKLALLYQATENLSLRASASTSFREPSLSQINADVVNTVNIIDYELNPDGTPKRDADGNLIQQTNNLLFIRQATTGNEDLKPEQATNYNLGVVWSSESWEARLDYWRIDYTDVITIESAQGKLAADPNGPTVVRQDPNDPTSLLTGISTDYFNAASIDASGIDLEATYTTDLAIGTLKLSAGWSRYLKYEVPVNGETIDAVGSFNFGNFVRSMPEDKGSFSAHWQNDHHSVYARVNYTSSYENNRQGDEIDSYAPVEVQYRYLFDLQDAEVAFSVGVINAFDEEAPEVRDGANFSYDPKHHDPRGRVFYVKGSYSF